MSQESVPAVRQPIAARAHSRRHLEERIGLMFPSALVFFTRLVLRLPCRSRLRKAMVRRTVRLGCEAINRGDYEVGFNLYDPDVEATFAAELATVGGESGTSGREARIRFQRTWSAEWNEFRFEPSEVVDLGDGRLLTVGRIKGGGFTSGADVDSDWALLLTIAAGRVVREQVFADHVEALEAVGLGE